MMVIGRKDDRRHLIAGKAGEVGFENKLLEFLGIYVILAEFL